MNFMPRRSPTSNNHQTLWMRLHIDPLLLLALAAVMTAGLTVLFSASGEDTGMVFRQAIRLVLGLGVMFALAQVSPTTLQRYAIPLYVVGVCMLIAVAVFGHIGKGAQRWLNLGFMKFQPSELMKLVVPITVSWFIARKQLPPKPLNLLWGAVIMAIPVLLIAEQPDLGTSILIAASGVIVLFMAGASWWIIGIFAALIAAFLPVLWFFMMHDYQRQRVLTFLNPENDPLGTGYHIIQSKIAIGSGGLLGKGYMQGTQSQLEFLPERHTDFIFAVFAEEWGYIGVIVLLVLYAMVISRGLVIAASAQQAFSRLLAGSIVLTFFVYVFVNIGMVSGLLPVVGVPLPLVSYGGTSGVTLLAGFGILMSIHTHRRFIE